MNFTIKDLEALSGVKSHTIRIWEQRYHFLKPSRTQTNIRSYTDDELKTLLTVALLNKYGYKISRIDEMSFEERSETVLSITHSEADSDRLVNQLVEYMIDLKSVDFENLLNDHIATFGLENTFVEIVFRFLEKVGVFWHASYIRTFQEHIVSNIVRQKLIRAIDDLPLNNIRNPAFCLLLPEDEYHELGLLFVYYLLRKNNLAVTYLGANVPLNDLFLLLNHSTPDYLYLHLTALPHKHNVHDYISNLSQKFPSLKILMSGSGIQLFEPDLPNITRFNSIKALSSFIKGL